MTHQELNEVLKAKHKLQGDLLNAGKDYKNDPEVKRLQAILDSYKD